MNLPRLVSIPLLLSLAGTVSYLLFREVERTMAVSLGQAGRSGAEDWAQHRTRLLATCVAVNIFFAYADPTLGAFGGVGGQLVRTIVLVTSVTWLLWAWQRDRRTYQRESASASLRKQLLPLEQELISVLDGRTINELSCDEIFALAKVLPQQRKVNCLRVYREVVADLISCGRVDKPQALLQLEELRSSLGLTADDHFAVIRDLANDDPEILALDASRLESRELRLEAAREKLSDFFEGLPDDQDSLRSLTSRQRRRLEEIRRESGLSEEYWKGLIGQYLDLQLASSLVLERELKVFKLLLESRASLLNASDGDILYRLVVNALDQQLISVAVALLRATQSADPESPFLRDWAFLAQWVPKAVVASVQQRGMAWSVPDPVVGLGDLQFKLPPLPGVLEALWQDPDPATAALALLMLRTLEPALASAVALRPRVGLEPALRLEDQLSPNGDPLDDEQILSRLRAAVDIEAAGSWLPVRAIEQAACGSPPSAPQLKP